MRKGREEWEGWGILEYGPPEAESGQKPPVVILSRRRRSGLGGEKPTPRADLEADPVAATGEAPGGVQKNPRGRAGRGREEGGRRGGRVRREDEEDEG